MAAQSPVTLASAGTGTLGSPVEVTTDTVEPSLSLVPAAGISRRIWPVGAVIEVR